MRTSLTKVLFRRILWTDKLLKESYRQVTNFKPKRDEYRVDKLSGFKVSQRVPRTYFNQSVRNIRSSHLFFVAFIILNLVQGQFVSNVSKVGTTAAPFLEIEVGSRALGCLLYTSDAADE